MLLIIILAVTIALSWIPWLLNRWRFRHIPGPFAPPVLGNLLGIAHMDLAAFLEHCRHTYGKVFKIYIGSNMLVCVAEPAAAKRVLSKLGFRHAGIQLTAGANDWDFLVDGLAGANGSTWRTLRAAWQPAFSPAALATYMPATQTALDQLLERLAAAAESGQVVQLSQELTAFTLDVVGQAAYGTDLHQLEQRLQQHRQQPAGGGSSSSLLGSMQTTFEGGGVANSSGYMVPVLLFPGLTRLWQWLAFHCPDRKLRILAKARQHIRQVSLQLLRCHQLAQQRDMQQATNGGCAAASHAATAAAVTSTSMFPRTLLAARDKDTGAALSDEQVVAQFNTFLLAAFETTAAAIAFSIYFIAQHPQVEARLLQELFTQRQVHELNGQQDVPQQQPLPYTEAVVKETLRLLPPGSIASRSTEQQGLQLTPQVWLPPNTAMFACIYCLHRDPAYWPHALDFRPERWLPEGADLLPCHPDAYMPYGAGGRLCVGRQFANMVVTAAVARLLQSFSFALEPGQVPVRVKQTFALIPAQGLRVRVHRRRSP